MFESIDERSQNIPDEAHVEAKINKLVAGVYDVKAEVAKVYFEQNIKIMELELKSEPSNLLEVREQCEATVKNGIATVDTAIVDSTTLFE